MYKTVNFNIFEEHLEDVVYGENSAARRREYRSAGAETAETPARKSAEIIIQPLNHERYDRRNENN